MAIKRYILNILLLVLYIAIGIPLISQFLLPMIMDFINSDAPFLNPQWCSTIYRIENGTSVPYTQCTGFDMRPLLLFIVQVGVYVLVPVLIIFGTFGSFRR